MLANTEALLFDLDGTIFDLELLNYKSYKDSFKSVLGINLSYTQYTQYISGSTRRDGVIRGLSSYKVDASANDIDRIVKLGRSIKKKQLMSDNIVDYVKVKDGVFRFIHLYQKSIPIALVTSTSRVFTERLLEVFKLHSVFNCIITANDVRKSKPDPEPFKLALHQLNIKNAVVFEDSLSGITSAKRARCYVIGIYTPFVNDEWIGLADAYISNYNELLNNQVE